MRTCSVTAQFSLHNNKKATNTVFIIMVINWSMCIDGITSRLLKLPSYFLRQPRLTWATLFCALLVMSGPAARAEDEAVALAEWDRFNTETTVFPKAADTVADGITASYSYFGLTTVDDIRTVWTGLNTTSTVNLGKFVEYTITCPAGATTTLTSLEVGCAFIPAGGSLVARSSADGFATDISSKTPGSSYETWSIPLSQSLAAGQSFTVRIYSIDAQDGQQFFNSDQTGTTARFLGEALKPAPTPTPQPSPTQPTKPTLQIGGHGKDDGRFVTHANRIVINGICSNIDTVLWKFAGDRNYKRASASGSKWKVKIGPLKKGNNFIRVCGLDSKTGLQTPPHNGVIIRK